MDTKKPDKATDYFKKELRLGDVQKSAHYTYRDGFRLGFGIFVGFMVGSVILFALSYVFSYVLSLF